jgi:predicted nucleotidyltransferase
MVTQSDRIGAGIFVSVPLPSEQIFRYAAMDDIVGLLVRNPHQEFRVRQLREITGHGGKTVSNALALLQELDLVSTTRKGQSKLVRVNRDRIEKPNDPILAIPQEEFRDPVRAYLSELEDHELDAAGVVLFGSVARGRADRTSDVDVLVVVGGDPTAARREAQAARQAVESRRFDGERYEFQVLVESIESARQYGPKLHEIFAEGIVLEGSDRLEAVKREVFDGEQ